MIVNAHFEPELTLRSPRERLRLITPHWPHYPDATGVTMGYFNIFDQRKEDSMFGMTFTDGDTGKAAFSLFLAFSKLPGLTIQGRLISQWCYAHTVQD